VNNFYEKTISNRENIFAAPQAIFLPRLWRSRRGRENIRNAP
jgi:hypothetical protein